jgi:hypothetical protein
MNSSLEIVEKFIKYKLSNQDSNRKITFYLNDLNNELSIGTTLLELQSFWIDTLKQKSQNSNICSSMSTDESLNDIRLLFLLN